MAAAIVVAMTAHILLEIVLRAFFGTSTYVLDEFIGYGVAAATFLALGYTLESGGHIRVTLLLDRLGQGRVKQAVELLCIGVLFSLTAFLWYYFWIGIVRNWTRGSVSSTLAEVPLWIPESLVLLGLTILALQLVGSALHLLMDSFSYRKLLAEQCITREK